jgi:hypothetical protein
LPFKQQRQGLLDTQHARQALGAAASREQTHRHFGQAEHRLRFVQQHAVVAGQAQLETTAQCGAIDRRDKRLAAGFHAPHEGAFGREALDAGRRPRTVDRLQDILQVGAGDEVGLT